MVALRTAVASAGEYYQHIHDAIAASERMNVTSGAAYLRRRIPLLANAAIPIYEAALSRVSVLKVRTRTGRTLRPLYVWLLDREETLVRDFRTDIAGSKLAYAAAARFAANSNKLLKQINSRFAAAFQSLPSDEREAIARVVQG